MEGTGEMEEIRFVSAKRAREITSLSERSILRKAGAGQFPQPVRLGEGNRIAFVESEVFAWNVEQLARARGHPPQNGSGSPEITEAAPDAPKQPKRRRANAQSGR